MDKLDSIGAHREKLRWKRIQDWAIRVAVILALLIAIVTFNQGRSRQTQINDLSALYTQVREDKTDLCDEPANENKPECATTPPPVEKVVKDPDPQIIIKREILDPGILQRLVTSSTQNELFQMCGETCAGTNGKDGKDGEVGETGLQGLQGTEGPVGPTGPAGTDGTNGTDGQDGRGIKSLECNPDGTWTVTYSDDTTQVVQGPCRVQAADPGP